MSKSEIKLSKKNKIILSVAAIVIILVLSYFFKGKDIFGSLNTGDAASSDIVVSSEDAVSSEPGTPAVSSEETSADESKPEKTIDKNGIYTSKEDVALYIHTYNKLPSNFIKKDDAEKLGWSGGGLDKYAINKCIGGDKFGNYEGILPKKSGRVYTECDIDTLGASSRGKKRIVFSNDGLIYYTDDHYETFTLLYGKE